MPIDQLIDIDWFSFLMRFVFSQDFQKHGLLRFNENSNKTLICSQWRLIHGGEHGYTPMYDFITMSILNWPSN